MRWLRALLPLCVVASLAWPEYAKGDVLADTEVVENGLVEEQEDFSQLLARVVSEPEGGVIHELFLLTAEDGSIERFERVSSSGKQEIAPQDLVDGEVVLAHTQGRDALLLSCPDCSIQTGGKATLRYLVNGVWMSYRNFDMELSKDGDRWHLYTSEGELIHSLRLVANYMFGQLVGIAELRVES